MVCTDSVFNFQHLGFDLFKVVSDTIEFDYSNDENIIKGKLLIPEFPVQYYSTFFLVDSLESIVKLNSFYMPHRIGEWNINGKIVTYNYRIVDTFSEK